MMYAIAGARGIIENPEKTIQKAHEWAAARGAEVLLADARAVIGRDHLETAVRHAVRAQAAGTMVARSISMEGLRYLAVQRQVADAIRVAGVRRGTEGIAIVCFGTAPLQELCASFGWSLDDTVLDARGKSLDPLGITDEEAATIPAKRRADLVLEKVALVDLLR